MKFKAYTSIKEVVKVLREVYPDFPMPLVLVLLEVGQNEGITVTQVEHATGLSQASASRHCRYLTAWKTPKEKGLGLAEFRPDPNDFRSKMIYLNEHGKALMQKLEEAVL